MQSIAEFVHDNVGALLFVMTWPCVRSSSGSTMPLLCCVHPGSRPFFWPSHTGSLFRQRAVQPNLLQDNSMPASRPDRLLWCNIQVV